MPKAEVRYVYFIEEASRLRPIKIGSANDVRRRLSSLRSQYPHPLTVLGVMRCADRAYLEHLLHYHFRAHTIRSRREWFRNCPEIRAYIASHAAPLEGCEDLPLWEPLFAATFVRAKAISSRPGPRWNRRFYVPRLYPPGRSAWTKQKPRNRRSDGGTFTHEALRRFTNLCTGVHDA